VVRVRHFPGHHKFEPGEPVVVAACGAAARIVPGVEPLQLGGEHYRLQRVETSVAALARHVHIALTLAVVAEQAAPLGEPSVARYHGAGFAHGPEVLGGIEAEGGGIADAAAGAPPVASAVRLRGVLHQLEPVAPSQLYQRIEIGRLTIEMNGQETRNAPAPLSIDEHSVPHSAVPRQVARHLLHGHAVGGGVDVDEQRRGARLCDPLDRSDERVGHRHHQVPGRDTHGLEGDPQGVGSARDAHAVRHAAVAGEVSLEVAHRRPANERGASDQLAPARFDLGAHLLLHRLQVEERNAA